MVLYQELVTLTWYKVENKCYFLFIKLLCNLETVPCTLVSLQETEQASEVFIFIQYFYIPAKKIEELQGGWLVNLPC